MSIRFIHRPGMGGLITIFAVLLLAATIASPALAGTKYMSGEPNLTTSVQGSNELSPGKEATIAVLVQNTGVNQFKFSQSGIVDRDDQPNTAKNVVVSLNAGDTPFIIKTDSQMVGDIKGSSSVPVKFTVKIPSDTKAGEYTLPINLKYSYLWDAEQYGLDTIEYHYKPKDVSLNLPVTVRPEISIAVPSASSDSLNAGNQGYLTADIMNTGSENVTRAVVKVSQNGKSPIVPVDGTVSIGEFPAGSSKEVRFKLAVSKDAQAQTYPVDITVTYQNREGDTLTTDPVTVSVPVGKKVDFKVVTPPASIHPGEKKTIEVGIMNTGGATIYRAQARITATDPFSSDDDTSFIGDLAPGETKTARFTIKADNAATVKEYSLDAEVRYRDALDTSVVSDSITVPINVVPSSGVNPIILGVIGVVAIAGGYVYISRRKKQAKSE
jgi:hypothetical protein